MRAYLAYYLQHFEHIFEGFNVKNYNTTTPAYTFSESLKIIQSLNVRQKTQLLLEVFQRKEDEYTDHGLGQM